MTLRRAARALSVLVVASLVAVAVPAPAQASSLFDLRTLLLGRSPSAAAPATPTAAATAGGALGMRARADDGARVVAETVVADGVLDLAIESPALGRVGMVRLFLPSRWTSSPTTAWPTLYVLHGANEPLDYRSWDVKTSIRSFMRGKDVLTVMPTGGGAGFYSDPWNYGRPGGENYETFHTVELPQLLERGYRSSGVRAVAGLSVGGFGALSYTGRHPGFFRASASYSGVLDTLAPGVPLSIVAVVRVRSEADVLALWGDPVLGRQRWREHNPIDLLPRMRGTPLYVSSGDGLGGTVPSASATGDTLPVDPIEFMAKGSFDRFTDRARLLGIPLTSHVVKDGAHDWIFWDPEFRRSWPVLAGGLGVDVQGRLP